MHSNTHAYNRCTYISATYIGWLKSAIQVMVLFIYLLNKHSHKMLPLDLQQYQEQTERTLQLMIPQIPVKCDIIMVAINNKINKQDNYRGESNNIIIVIHTKKYIAYSENNTIIHAINYDTASTAAVLIVILSYI